MHIITVFVTLFVLPRVIVTEDYEDDVHRWLNYKAEYGKVYRNSDEEWCRFNTFLTNKDFVESHNALYEAGELTYSTALNQFADMTNEEFRGLRRPVNRNSGQTSPTVWIENSQEIPASVDWREKGAVTSVTDQGTCESGWAFSTAGAIEALHKQVHGKLEKLSAQQLVDCVRGNDQCNGGDVNVTFDYVIQNGGIASDESYPYTTTSGDCMDNVSVVVANITSYRNVQKGNERQLTATIAKAGPVAVEIDSRHVSFQFYSDGVYYEKDCHTNVLDHSVLIVGYGTVNKTSDYYIVKNSWGTTWGQLGYIKMARNRNNNCGIATAAYYPI